MTPQSFLPSAEHAGRVLDPQTDDDRRVTVSLPTADGPTLLRNA